MLVSESVSHFGKLFVVCVAVMKSLNIWDCGSNNAPKALKPLCIFQGSGSIPATSGRPGRPLREDPSMTAR